MLRIVPTVRLHWVGQILLQVLVQAFHPIYQKVATTKTPRQHFIRGLFIQESVQVHAHVAVGLVQHAHKILVLSQTHRHACVAAKFVQIPQACFATNMEISAPPASFQCVKLSTACQKMPTTVPAD